jgi:hypothetical protein
MEKTRKEDILRSQLAERDAHELTFQPHTNASKYLSASVARRLKAARSTTDKDKEREADTAQTRRGRDHGQGRGQSNVKAERPVGGSKDHRATARHEGETKRAKGTGQGAREEGVGSVTSSTCYTDGAELRDREGGRTMEVDIVRGSHSDRDDESMSDGSRGDSIDLTALGSTAHSLKQSQRRSPTEAEANGSPDNNNKRSSSGGVNERTSPSGIDGDGDCGIINVSSDLCSRKRGSNICKVDALHPDPEFESDPEGDPPATMTMMLTPIARATYDTIRLRDFPDEEEDEDSRQGQGQGGAVPVSVTHSCHERLYQLGLEHWTRLDEIHQVLLHSVLNCFCVALPCPLASLPAPHSF